MPQLPVDALIALRMLLALVFLVAGAGKLGHREELEGVIANYRVLPRPLAGALSYVLGPVEVLIGLALLGGAIASPVAELAAAAVLLVFAGAMGINLLRGRSHIDCGCFRGTLRQTLRRALVVRNVVLAAAAALCAVLPVAGASGWQMANGVAAGIALFVLLQGMNTLWAVDASALLARGQPAWAARGEA